MHRKPEISHLQLIFKTCVVLSLVRVVLSIDSLLLSEYARLPRQKIYRGQANDIHISAVDDKIFRNQFIESSFCSILVMISG